MRGLHLRPLDQIRTEKQMTHHRETGDGKPDQQPTPDVVLRAFQQLWSSGLAPSILRDQRGDRLFPASRPLAGS